MYAAMELMTRMMADHIGWLVMKDQVWKNVASKNPIVDLDRSFGGSLITKGMVSRIEVRDGMMLAPLLVESQ